MKLFKVSRIHTDFGIFKVSGEWSVKKTIAENIKIHSIEVMGTDGWVLLDLNNCRSAELISKLQPLLLSHLLQI